MEDALKHLRRNDQRLRPVIRRIGPCMLRRQRNRFRMIVRSIVGQQLSAKAARTIYGRFETLIGSKNFAPEDVLRFSVTELKTVGLSKPKASYIHEAACRIADGEIVLRTIGRLDNEEVISKLTNLRGVGVWTAQMFLIFSLGRLDILPHDDQGIRAAMQKIYGLDEMPDKQTMDTVAKPWRPYASVACWYCWRSLD